MMNWARAIVSYAVRRKRRVFAWIRTWHLCNAIRKHIYLCSTLSVPRKHRRRTGLRALALVASKQDALPPFVTEVNYAAHMVEFTSVLGKRFGRVRVSVARPGATLNTTYDATWQHRDHQSGGRIMQTYRQTYSQHTLRWTDVRPPWYLRISWKIERAVVRAFGYVYTGWIQRARTHTIKIF